MICRVGEGYGSGAYLLHKSFGRSAHAHPFSSDTDLTCNYAVKINGIVYLNFAVTGVNITAGSIYTKMVMTGNLPNKSTPCIIFANANNTPTSVQGTIDKWGQLNIRAGGGAVSGAAYTVFAIYRV